MRRRGFSLIEVLVAIALVMTLIGSMSWFLLQVLGDRRRTLELTERQLVAATLLQRLEADLLTCVAGSRHDGAGVAGDERSISILSRSVPAAHATRGPRDPSFLADLQRCRYRFEPASGRITAERQVPGHADASDAPLDMGAEIATVRFRYHDGRDWRREFDSLRSGRLPEAVEVAIWFDEPSEDPTGPPEAPPVVDEPGSLDAGVEANQPSADEGQGESWEPLDLSRGDELPAPDRIRVIRIADPDAPQGQEDRP